MVGYAIKSFSIQCETFTAWIGFKYRGWVQENKSNLNLNELTFDLAWSHFSTTIYISLESETEIKSELSFVMAPGPGVNYTADWPGIRRQGPPAGRWPQTVSSSSPRCTCGQPCPQTGLTSTSGSGLVQSVIKHTFIYMYHSVLPSNFHLNM